MSAGVPRIESLKVENYRALRRLELTALTPLTVLLGPNGSGKSTVFDVFAFLSECFTDGLRRAWDRRGRMRELRTRDSTDLIRFEIKYREALGEPLITYALAIDEDERGVVVAKESLKYRRGSSGQPFAFLDFRNGEGQIVSGDKPDEGGTRIHERLAQPDALAVSAFGQLASNPRVAALRDFITGWHLSYLSADHTRNLPEAGEQEHLSRTGDNLPNVIQYLNGRHKPVLDRILTRLRERVPRLQTVVADTMPDGRLLLQIQDAPFSRPVLSRFASDGTLKMLAYLVLLNDPAAPPLLGIEEPENQLHPRLLTGLAEECRHVSGRSQIMVTTHSPFFVNAIRPKELWVLYRDEEGFTNARRASDMPGITEQVNDGALLGDLWMEGVFDVGDPLVNSGGTKGRRAR